MSERSKLQQIVDGLFETLEESRDRSDAAESLRKQLREAYYFGISGEEPDRAMDILTAMQPPDEESPYSLELVTRLMLGALRSSSFSAMRRLT